MKKQYWIYLETTEWQEPTQANHVYVFLEPPRGRGAMCMGYVRAGTKELFRFKQPMVLNLRDRSFVPLT